MLRLTSTTKQKTRSVNEIATFYLLKHPLLFNYRAVHKQRNNRIIARDEDEHKNTKTRWRISISNVGGAHDEDATRTRDEAGECSN